MVGTTFTGAGLEPAAALAAAADLLRRPPTIEPTRTRCCPKNDGQFAAETLLDAAPTGAVAVVTTGFVTMGTCETAMSAPDIPETSVEVFEVSTAGAPTPGSETAPLPLPPPPEVEAAAAAAAPRLRLDAPAAAALDPPEPPEAAPAAAWRFLLPEAAPAAAAPPSPPLEAAPAAA